jgi:hypothetical protein
MGCWFYNFKNLDFVKNFIFSFLLILTITNAFSQSKESIIRFETKYLENQRIEFSINGLTIIPDKEKHTIKIHKKDLDTLVCYKNNKQYSLSVLKFKENVEYIISINPCSLYDIRPAKNPKKGVVRYNYISSKSNSINAELDFYSQKITSGKKTDYYGFIPSAMCVFGKKKIAVSDSKNDKELSSIYFNFLHGEN